MTDLVRFTVEDSIGVITLDRPPVNAISADLLRELERCVGEAQHPSVRAVIVTGSPHFAAGADIKEFKASLDSGGSASSLGATLSTVLLVLERLPKPVIAAVRGFALGGGMEIVLACDFRLFVEDAHCGQPEIALGIIPGAGGTQRLPRLIGPGPARDLIYSGRQVDAGEALSLGIADAVHPEDELDDAARELAARYAAGPTAALGLAKQAINDGLGQPLDAGLRLESELFQAAFGSEDATEGVSAFVEKRDAEFKGR